LAVRIASRAGRAVLVSESGDRYLDLAEASAGRFEPDPGALWPRFDELRDWSGSVDPASGVALDAADLGPCVPRPGSVFAIGLNYRDHAEEAGLPVPVSPMVFTKFPSCLSGPRSDVEVASDRVDWEAELVVVIGRAARAVPEARALHHVAGYCVGQDVSDRRLQFSDKPAQFSLGKSLAGFGPIGPAVVSLDALVDPLDLAISCDVAGERMQDSRTSRMIFPVPSLVTYLSRHRALAPGDLIFTGTPAGVGSVRDPRRYLAVGEEIVTEIEGLGVLRNRCVAPG